MKVPLPSLPLLLLALGFLSAVEISATNGPALRVPDGFTVEQVAGAPHVRFPMFAAFDERGRLFVAESSGGDLYDELQKQTRRCRVSVLEDRDGDGFFELAQVFAEQLVFPMGLAWSSEGGGRLYVADPPDLITLEDTDGDGRADKRTVLLSGFGHSDNGSLHGLRFGPDGWLYLTMGEPDGYRIRRRDGSLLEGKSGALLRCRPDGSGVEVLSRGFVNLVEIAFLPGGEIIGTDNWFQRPADGLRDALVHLVEGGLYPYVPDRGTPQLVTGEPLPPLALYPAVALSGLEIDRGPSFPEAMRGSLFSAQHNSRKVVRHQLERAGATFRAVDQDFVWTDDPDFHPSDVLEDAEGSLLVVDTGSWYVHHCPTGRIRNSPAPGGIYRVRYLASARIEDPLGLKLAWKDLPVSELAQRLADRRTAVRERATEELVRRGVAAVPSLRRTLADSSPEIAKQHAVWALARLESEPARAALRETLASADAELVALAARALGRTADARAGPALVPLLRHPAAHVQFAAAEALAHCGGARSVPALLARLADEADRFLEHALVHALHSLADATQLAAALGHSSPRVQQAALRLLDQPPHQNLSADAVLKHVFAADEPLRRAAQSILRRHPEWVTHALPVLRELLASPTPTERNTLRDFVVAFCRHSEVAALLAQAATSETEASEAVRVTLLEAMAQVAPQDLPRSWPAALGAALKSPSRAVQAQALRAVNALQVNGVTDPLGALAGDAAVPAELRVGALRALTRHRPALDPAGFDLLLGQLARTNHAPSRLAALEVVIAAALEAEQFTRFIRAIRGDPLVPPTTILATARRAKLDDAGADGLLEALAQAAQAGWQLPDTQLVWLESAVPSGRRGRVQELINEAQHVVSRQRDQLVEFEPLLRGGDSSRGRRIFEEKTACIACHRVGSQGGLTGPDLTRIGAIRSGRDLIESIVMPSATFAQGYETYTATMRDGETLTGVRVAQPDDTLVLRDASGAETRIDRGQTLSIERQKLSLMPEGLLSALSREEIGDLLAYLQGLK
jgi:putative membrane-bound dehydrogenase-like protein